MITAYYLSDERVAEFERESYNLRQELNRPKELYSNGFISLPDFQEKALTIGKNLETYQPTAQPEVREIVGLLKDFPRIWNECNPTERKKLLKVMFLSIYFDPESTIRMILAHAHLIGYCPLIKLTITKNLYPYISVRDGKITFKVFRFAIICCGQV